MTAREMVLVGFMQAQNCSNYPASWRHPDAVSYTHLTLPTILLV